MQPQNENDDVAEACLIRLRPRALEISLEPPTPNRFDTADRNINAGMHTVTAVSFASLPVMPIKNVSAIL